MNTINPEDTSHTTATSASTKLFGSQGALVVGLLAGITASACCAGPLILLLLGVSGSWIGNLSALEPYRPIFILLAALFLGLAYRKIFLKSKTCDAGAVCATQQGRKQQQILFWITSSIVVLSISFPWYGPLLFDN